MGVMGRGYEATEEVIHTNEKICGNKQILKHERAKIGTSVCVCVCYHIVLDFKSSKSY